MDQWGAYRVTLSLYRGECEGRGSLNSTTTPAEKPKEPPTFVVTLTARQGSSGIHELRAFLKLALRRFGLKCVSVEERPS